jgi:hypothetical protein
MFYEGTDGTQQTDFGILYPRDFIIAAFPSHDDAVHVRDNLIAGGQKAAECVLGTSEAVASAAERNLSEHPGWLSRLGGSDEALQKHIDAARQGATFLRIYAPNDRESERTMNVVRLVPFTLARRYQRFAIQDLH